MKIAEKLKNIFKLFTLRNLKKLVIFLAIAAIVYFGFSFICKKIDVINRLYFFRTNLFDFIIFATIIAGLCIRFDVASLFTQAKENIDTSINDSTKAKEVADEKLRTIEESLTHIAEEVDSILKKSEDNANIVGEKILEEAKKSISVINDNADKAIENSENILRNDLIKRASLASVEVAKKYIIDELKDNLELHNKLIDESLNAMERVDL